MLLRLALETKPHHASADADRLALLEDPSAQRYRMFLARIYTFESRYEQALVQTPGLDPRIVRARMRAARARDDLLALGAAPAELLAWTRPPIPVFRSEAQALGWIYVVERNTLLHGLLRRHLARALADTMERASRYLGAYDAPGMRYRELGGELDAGARRAIPSQIVEAAHAAFACQRLWFAHVRGTARRLAS
jgi:heme oxygenase